MPLGNNTVSRRIAEVSEDVENQSVWKLKTRNFSVQIDESTLRANEGVLMAYVRYVNEDNFAEETCRLF